MEYVGKEGKGTCSTHAVSTYILSRILFPYEGYTVDFAMGTFSFF